MIKVAALTSSLPADLPEAISQIAELGFEMIDVPPAAAEGDARERLQTCGLPVSCVALERGQPSGLDLAAEDDEARARAVGYYRRTIEQTAMLDCGLAYLTPPTRTDDQTRRCWTDSILLLADHAEVNRVQLCIEHFPVRLLPTAAITLEFIRQLGHASLSLLLDVGHCLISNEEAATVIVDAADSLGYVHFDDNDGREDLHWALLDGKLTEDQIRRAIEALRQTGYDAAVCLELNSNLDQPIENLRRGKTILEEHLLAR